LVHPGGNLAPGHPYHHAMLTTLLLTGALCAVPDPQIDLSTLPIVEVTTDNVKIDRSSRLVVPAGTFIEDTDGNGVVHIVADHVVVGMESDGGWLSGSDWNKAPDQRGGIGVRIDGHSGVSLVGLRVRGFGVGIEAIDTIGLSIDGCDLRDGFGRPLNRPGASPIDSDRGTGILLRGAVASVVKGTTIRSFHRGVWGREAASAAVYDSDISYLSGDGITLIDSPDTVLSNNTLDGLYAGASRTAAGIKLLGNASRTVVAQNAIRGLGQNGVGIHLGQIVEDGNEWMTEMLVIDNTIAQTARGIVAGGVSESVIAGNTITDATDAAMHIEADQVVIAANTIQGGATGVRVAGSGLSVRDNTFSDLQTAVEVHSDGVLVAKNSVSTSAIGVRATGDGHTVQLGANSWNEVAQEVALEDGAVSEDVVVTMEIYSKPEYETPGSRDAIGQEPTVATFEPRTVGDYFPWDGESVEMRTTQQDGRRHVFEVYGGSPNLWATLRSNLASLEWSEPASEGEPTRFAVNGPSGVHPYEMRVAELGKFDRRVSGTLLRARWRVDAFEWESDPKTSAEAWRAESTGDNARRARTTELQYDFADMGPSELSLSGAVIRAKMRPDRFGLVATSKLPLAAGVYDLVASIGPDDGVRLFLDGELATELWTTSDEEDGQARARIQILEARDVDVLVEYADFTGPARLNISIEPVSLGSNED
jgi:hypothetical protein